jgi:fructosamine-3-kinase
METQADGSNRARSRSNRARSGSNRARSGSNGARTGDSEVWTKPADGPSGASAAEAAGLRWLAEAPDGIRTAAVLAEDTDRLVLERLPSAEPTAEAARAAGRALARTHAAGAEAFGALPPGAPDDRAFFGPAEDVRTLPAGRATSWGAYLAENRLRPAAEQAAGRLEAEDLRRLDDLCSALAAGRLDDDEPPARVHGDLWSGNLLWTRADDGSTEAAVIDPAAHGDHPATDLAMLALFGAPHLDALRAGYAEVRPQSRDWERAEPLHQLFPLLMHVALFGTGYLGPARRALAAALALTGRE